MIPQKLAFVDIETTGVRSAYDRIIEIGIVVMEDNKVVKTYSTLINPDSSYLPPEITQITGITASELTNAPTFREVADEILEYLEDTVFVAHNVRFDYGFLKNEFKRLNKSFNRKHFCTVRLSRLLYPTLPRHNLDSLITNLNIPCERRHRALDDAQVISVFYQKAKKEFPDELFTKAVATVLKKPYLPVKLSEDILNSLPEEPGVYIFYGEDGAPLYIGKSINIKERVLSHFSGDLHSPLEMKIAQQVLSIETKTTAGELGALFLESQMIKEMLPLFNRMLRRKRELIALRSYTAKDGFLSIRLETLDPTDITNPETFLGFFSSRRHAKSYLISVAKEYALCEKLLGTDTTLSACFAYRLGACQGACAGKEKPLSYNMRFQEAFLKAKIKRWPFSGPIVIAEKNEDKTQYFLVDQWCFFGTVTTDDYGVYKEDTRKYIFDLDTYKILLRFLSKPEHYKLIKELPSNKEKDISQKSREYLSLE